MPSEQMGEVSKDVCFICLGDESDGVLGPLGHACKCPTMVSHRQCMLRWQLQQAGKQEECKCRFCGQQLEDWKQAVAHAIDPAYQAPPVMAVVFQGKTIKVPVSQGPGGIEEFKKTVCSLFNLPAGTEFEVTFECKSPVFGDKLHLKGFDCFEAASYCAAVSAAKRAKAKAKAHASSHSHHAADSSSSTPTSSQSGPTVFTESGPMAAGSSRRSSCATPFGSHHTQSRLQHSSRGPSLEVPAGVSSARASSNAATPQASPSGRQPSCSPSFLMQRLKSTLLHGNSSGHADNSHVAGNGESRRSSGGASPQSSNASTQSVDTDLPATASRSASSVVSTAAHLAAGRQPSLVQPRLPSMQSHEPPAAHVNTTPRAGGDQGDAEAAGRKPDGRITGALASFFKRVL